MARRLVAALGAVALLIMLAPARGSAVTYIVETFVAVDAIRSDTSLLTVTGVRAGEGEPVTIAFYLPLSGALRASCERQALLAQAKPGQYVLALEHTIYTSSGGYLTSNCTLTRAVP